MNAQSMEDEYLSPAMREELPRAAEAWARDAAAYREEARDRAALDVAYGDKPRQKIDLFMPPGNREGSVALFIHGGYWQFMDKSSSSHMARGLNAHGVTVAVVGYTLCPENTVAGIVDELRSAVAFVARRFRKPITIYGHSAGGHLTACMMTTSFRAIDPSLGDDTVRAGMPISGLFELEPLLETSLNKRLGLDAAAARRLSPLFWQAPTGKRAIAYVGGSETEELQRQTRALVSRWGSSGVSASAVVAEGASHFGVVAPLAEPDSAMTKDLVGLCRGRGGA